MDKAEMTSKPLAIIATVQYMTKKTIIYTKWNTQYCILEQENQIFLISLIMNMT